MSTVPRVQLESISGSKVIMQAAVCHSVEHFYSWASFVTRTWLHNNYSHFSKGGLLHGIMRLCIAHEPFVQPSAVVFCSRSSQSWKNDSASHEVFSASHVGENSRLWGQAVLCFRTWKYFFLCTIHIKELAGSTWSQRKNVWLRKLVDSGKFCGACIHIAVMNWHLKSALQIQNPMTLQV